MTDLLAAIEAAIAEDERAASAFRNDLGDVRAWRCDDVGGKVRDAGPMPFVLPSSDLFRDGSGGLGDCACCRYPWPCDTVRHLADGYGIEVP